MDWTSVSVELARLRKDAKLLASDFLYKNEEGDLCRLNQQSLSQAVRVSKMPPVLYLCLLPPRERILAKDNSGQKAFWKIKEKGEGGFGKVFAVQDEQGQYRALKIEKPRSRTTCPIAESTEVKLWQQLSNDPKVSGNIIQLFQCFEVMGCPSYLMELGKASARCLQRPDLLDRFWESAADFLVQEIAPTLMYMHSFDLVHSDIKADNLIITSLQPLRLKLCDFGSAGMDGDNLKSCTRRYMSEHLKLLPKLCKKMSPLNDFTALFMTIEEFADDGIPDEEWPECMKQEKSYEKMSYCQVMASAGIPSPIPGETFHRSWELDPGNRGDVLAAVSKDPAVLTILASRWKDDPDVVETAIRQSGHALQYVSERHRMDPRVVMEAVREDGRALSTAPPEMRGIREIVLTAVQDFGHTLQYADAKIQADPEVVLAAVSQDHDALQYASPKLFQDPAFMQRVAAKTGLSEHDMLKAGQPYVPAMRTGPLPGCVHSHSFQLPTPADPVAQSFSGGRSMLPPHPCLLPQPMLFAYELETARFADKCSDPTGFRFLSATCVDPSSELWRSEAKDGHLTEDSDASSEEEKGWIRFSELEDSDANSDEESSDEED